MIFFITIQHILKFKRYKIYVKILFLSLQKKINGDLLKEVIKPPAIYTHRGCFLNL